LFVFHFRVKFYVSEPSKLKEEYTRYSQRTDLLLAFLCPVLCRVLREFNVGFWSRISENTRQHLASTCDTFS